MVCPSPNGFNKGIHKWAVKYAKNAGLGTYAEK